MKLLPCFLLPCCLFLFPSFVWGHQKTDDGLIAKAKVWYTDALKTKPHAEFFNRPFQNKWEEAFVLNERTVVVPVDLSDTIKNNFNTSNYRFMIFEFDAGEKLLEAENISIVSSYPLADIPRFLPARKNENISGFTGQLGFQDILRETLPTRVSYYKGIKQERNPMKKEAVPNPRVPVLEDGSSPQNALNTGFFRGISGYSIFSFRVRKDGTVDSIRISSRYFAGAKQDSINRAIDQKDREIISKMRFKPLVENTWVQCKVYTYFYNNRTGDPVRYKETADHFRTFNYGLKELWENEIDAYFRDPDGKINEYIIRDGVIIFAPSYRSGIT